MAAAKKNPRDTNRSSAASDPAEGIFAIAYTSGTCDPPFVGRGLLITTAGNLNVVCKDGTTGIIAVSVGVLPLRVKQIVQASSTAAGFILL